MRPVEGALLFAAMAVVLALAHNVRVECFESIEAKDAEVMAQTKATQLVFAAYMDVMKRPPSPEELDANSRRVRDKGLTRFDLENILLNSEEYLRDVKNQSDDPNSELRRVTSEQFVIAHLVNLFEIERGERPVPKIILPLKDVYQLLGPQDDARFREFLSSEFYPEWENDVLMRQRDSYKTSTTLDVFDLWYRGNSSRLVPSGGNRQADADPTLLAHSSRSTVFDGRDFAGGYGDGGTSFGRPDVMGRGCGRSVARGEVWGAGGGCLRAVEERDGDVGPVIDAVEQKTKPFRLYFNPEKDLVLDPAMKWRLPDERPPVCSTLGAPTLAQPYMVVDKQLIGTPLRDAATNDIMPKFEFRQYVEIPEDQVRIVKREDRVDGRE